MRVLGYVKFNYGKNIIYFENIFHRWIQYFHKNYDRFLKFAGKRSR